MEVVFREVLATRRWVILTVVVILVQPAFIWLGLWQWGRGVDTRDLRNLAYGIQWWLFAALAVGGWVKMLRDEVRERLAGLPTEHYAPAPVGPDGAVQLGSALLPAPALAEEEEDDELTAYNAYLAWLHANPRA